MVEASIALVAVATLFSLVVGESRAVRFPAAESRPRLEGDA